MTLYDDHFNVLNTPVSNFSGRLTLLDFEPDPASGGNGSFIVYGGQMTTSPVDGTTCPQNNCFSLFYVYANYNTPFGFTNGVSGVYTAYVRSLLRVRACVALLAQPRSDRRTGRVL